VTLTEIMEPKREGDGSFSLEIPDSWQQGRGAFGGLVLGGLVRCVELSEEDPSRTLRSLTAVIAAPVLIGTARVNVTHLRRGNAVSMIRASIAADGEILAELTGVLGRDRPATPEWQRVPRLALPDWQDLEIAPIAAPIAPVFTQHFEYRLVGDLPFMGGGEPVSAGWIRPRDPGASRGAAYLTACMDAWWPSSAVTFDGPRPVATMNFMLDFVGTTEGLPPDAPYAYVGATPVAVAGYTGETRELWGEDGRLLALNRQTIAIIK
jgi:hypothetical protein